MTLSEHTKAALLELLFAPATTPATTGPGGDPAGMHIVILDRGFVYVGDCSFNGDWLKVTKCRNIRVWGTKNGLGELRTGPTSETVLDECDSILVPRKAIIHLMPCTGF